MNITNRNYTNALTGIQVIHTPSERSVQQSPTEGVKFTAPEYTREPYNGGPI